MVQEGVDVGDQLEGDTMEELATDSLSREEVVDGGCGYIRYHGSCQFYHRLYPE